MSEYKFTEGALEQLGFQIVEEGGFRYWEYVFDKESYMESQFLATEDLEIPKDRISWFPTFKVINAGGEDEGSPYMTFTEVVQTIANGKI